MRQVLIIGIVFLLLIGGLSVGILVQGTGDYPNKENINPNRTLFPQREEIPVRLIIPKLGIDTTIESIGMDAQEAMDVPKDIKNVGWYNLGFRPGEKGNSVIAGHFDDVNGNPAVFYRLKELEVGDEVISVDSKGVETKFIVAQKVTYKEVAFPLEEVFGEFPIARLNLITCQGTFVNGSHNERLVVYTRLP